MSEKLPTISGKTLIRFLESLGYVVVRQRGSHVRLIKETVAGNHKMTVPIHDPVAKGTLADILSKVAYTSRQTRSVKLSGHPSWELRR